MLSQSVSPVPGIKVGKRIPSISAEDQFGHPQTFESLRGKHGLLLLFSRSADWCPYCKRHLMEFEQAKPEFEAKGIHVASITYDSVGILKDFSNRKGITYPMLSDTGSKIIRAFDILNPEGKGFAAGIPYPGIYYISPEGVILKRYFESQYSDRFTPNDIYADIFGVSPLLASEAEPIPAAHITLRLSQSDKIVGAGNRLKLLVHIEPAAHIHLYAPGAEKNGYRVVKLQIGPSADYRSEPLNYPPSTLLTFPELKETVPVYSKATVLSEDVIISATKEFNSSIGDGKDLHITGTLFYQACDDHKCFLPVQQPVRWVVHVQPFDLIRSPESLRHEE
ncbi:MAG: peroxiredoxin family protein [Edaphobacter sp.]